MSEKKEKAIKHIKVFMNMISEADINTYAASLTFFLFLSLVPVLIILSFLLPLTGQGSSELIEYITGIMPDYFDEFAGMIILDIYNRTSRILPFYIVILIWTASGSLFALTKGLHRVYRVRSSKATILIRLQAVLYTVLMLVFFFVSLLFLVFQDRLTRYFIGLLPQRPLLSSFFLYWRHFITIPLYLIFLTVIYYYISNVKQKLRYHFPGALVTTAGWLLFGRLFTVYLNHVKTYDTFYGNLSILIVLLLWLYFCCYILLTGGLLNYYLIKHRGTYFEMSRGK